MAQQIQKFKIIGASPLLLHSGQLADPLNEWSKALKKVSGKRAKTEADFEEMGRIEWYGGLYVLDGRVVLPGEMIEACIINGARKTKSGKAAQAGVYVLDPAQLVYPHCDKSIDEIFSMPQYRLRVGVKMNGSATVMRTRPKFDTWSATFAVTFDDTLFNPDTLHEWLITAGQIVGVGDWRPRYGRFGVEVI